MAKMQNDVTWVEVDVASLGDAAGKAYETYKTAQRAAAELRVKFEGLVNEQAALPEGRKMVFGYRFGKLSAAIVEADTAAKKSAPAKLSLSDYLKREAGH
jgi:hypothetical protein